MPKSDDVDIDAIILDAHKRSFERAFETAVRTGTALVFMRNGKIVKEKPKYEYVLRPIKKRKKRKSAKKS